MRLSSVISLVLLRERLSIVRTTLGSRSTRAGVCHTASRAVQG